MHKSHMSLAAHKQIGYDEVWELNFEYHKLTSSNMSCLEPHPDFYKLLMKGIFYAYVLHMTFWQKMCFESDVSKTR